MRLPVRIVEINGGTVKSAEGAESWRLSLPATSRGYADAQIDDYGGRRRSRYRWRRGTRLGVEARFSHDDGALAGTAGFGFWNAPFGPGTGPLPTLPQAVWFFFGSPRNDLPFAPAGERGNGWFASTIDAGTVRAMAWAPLGLPVLLANQLLPLRQRLWPAVQRSLAISFRRLPVVMNDWHRYELEWRAGGCSFHIDGEVVLQTSHSPRGPLGFVAWIDNQYLVARPTGRFCWGTEKTSETQILELRKLQLEQY
jgi:hypothetical protein